MASLSFNRVTLRPPLIKFMFLVRELPYNWCGREVFIIHYDDITACGGSEPASLKSFSTLYFTYLQKQTVLQLQPDHSPLDPTFLSLAHKDLFQHSIREFGAYFLFIELPEGKSRKWTFLVSFPDPPTRAHFPCPSITETWKWKTRGKGLAKNYARKWLDGRNAAGCVDEGKNVSPANQRSSSTNDRKQIYGRT